jgi:hypothetical protein
MHICGAPALFGFADPRCESMILTLFTSVPPCLAILMQVQKADFDAIYVIPALFGV